MKQLSCGIIIFKDDIHILGCHCTGKSFGEFSYDIPKGLKENGEAEIDCVKRELFEETGLNLDEDIADKMILGTYDYLPHKNLFLITGFTHTKKSEDFSQYKCTSLFKDKFGKEKPEVNGYKWVNIEQSLNLFYRSLGLVLRNAIQAHKEKWLRNYKRS